MRILRPGPALAAAFFALLIALPAHAVSNRIFMSTNGNNASDCANPLTPCLTFAGALAQVNPGGEVIAEATGGYGALNITQAVTISGPPGVVIYSGLQVVVNAPGATVVLRGLTIDGTGAVGNGINVVSVAALFVENCVITGFVGPGSQGNGIFFGSPGTLFVSNTVTRSNGHVGIYAAPSSGGADVSIDHCRSQGNQYGVVADPGAQVTIRESVASGNTSAGLFAEGGELNVESCVSSHNGIGVDGSAPGLVRLSNTTITENTIGAESSISGTILSRGNNTLEANGTGNVFDGSYSEK